MMKKVELPTHRYIVFRDLDGDTRAIRYSDLRENRSNILYLNAVTEDAVTQRLIQDHQGQRELQFDWVEIDAKTGFEAKIIYGKKTLCGNNGIKPLNTPREFPEFNGRNLTLVK
jgi:hypothetical protein